MTLLVNIQVCTCKENLLKCTCRVCLYLINWLSRLIWFCYVDRHKICSLTTTVSPKITKHILFRYLFSNESFLKLSLTKLTLIGKLLFLLHKTCQGLSASKPMRHYHAKNLHTNILMWQEKFHRSPIPICNFDNLWFLPYKK